jgi:predicted RNA binding protein YcfA (HicA-like mRNA interferase family)
MKEPNDQKSWIKRLQQEGWTHKRGGSHQVKMVKASCRPITLPMNKGSQYPKGLNAAIRNKLDFETASGV